MPVLLSVGSKLYFPKLSENKHSFTRAGFFANKPQPPQIQYGLIIITIVKPGICGRSNISAKNMTWLTTWCTVLLALLQYILIISI